MSLEEYESDYLDEQQVQNAVTWSGFNHCQEEIDIKNFWADLPQGGKEELMRLCGYTSKFASYGFSSLSSEMKSMLIFVIRK